MDKQNLGTTDKVTADMVTALKTLDITQVCSGKRGCCCGCKGKHSYASAHRDWSGSKRGYALDASDINDSVVTRITNHVFSAPLADLRLVAFGDTVCLTHVTATRNYTIYFRR